MARGKVYHTHAFTGQVDSEPSVLDNSRIWETHHAFCGHTATMISSHQDPILDATCPKCGQKWGAVELAKLSGRVVLEQVPDDEKSSYYKSLFKVLLDGVHRGYILVENGWGKKWEIRKLAPTIESYGRGVGGMVGQPDRYNPKKNTDGSPVRDIHRSARDASAAIIPILHDGGFLPTREEMQAADEARRRERELEDQRRQERTKQRQQDRIDALETIQSLRERAAALGLTNADLNGLAAMENFL